MQVSVLILTLNEERNLERCLDALSWCDDVIVLDSFSTDATSSIAEARGARFLQRKFTSFADQRNFALGEVAFRHRWVLHLDADEIVTKELRDELVALPDDSSIDAYQIAGKLMLGDQWLRHSGMYPVYQVRLTRRPEFRFVQVGHGQQEPRGLRVRTINACYEHFSFSKGISDWIDRHNRYSTDEAMVAIASRSVRASDFVCRNPSVRRRALKSVSYRLRFRPALRFMYVYLIRLGFLDGSAGYEYARLLSMYEGMIDAKIRELVRIARGRN